MSGNAANWHARANRRQYAVLIVLRAIATSFLRALTALLIGGSVAVGVELGLLMWDRPSLIGQAHRYLAPILPGALLLAGAVALPSVIWRLLRRRRAAPEARRRAAVSTRAWVRDERVLLWLGLSVLAFAFGAGGAWLAFARHLQLPLDAALFVGAGVAGLALAVFALAIGRHPPTPILVCGLIAGAWIAGGPGHRVAPQYALAPAAALWLTASTLTVPRPRVVAIFLAVVCALGVWRYDDDLLTMAEISKDSFVSAPLASAVRAAVDMDQDGVSGLLGGGDCDDLDPDVHPRATEVVANGVDDNCLGGDLERAHVPPADIDQASPDYAPPAPLADESPRPDVLFITLDAVRADHLRPEHMPTLHALAERGRHAPIAYTPAPYTGFAFIDTMTSNPTMEHHEDNLFYGYEPTLAQVLGHAGYRTVAVHCIVDLPADMVHGFQFVDNTLGPRCEDFRNTSSDGMAEIAISYIRDRTEDPRPLFLWVHFVDPHLPYIGGYPAELARTDKAAGRLLAALERPTITVVFSDHGESFGLHGYEGHVWRLDEEMLRVVLFLQGPGVPPGRVSWPATLIDIAPTVAELVGIRAPAGWSGKSLLRDPGERPILFQSDYRGELDLRGARIGAYKVTQNRRTGAFELYNVVDDPDDQHNLVADRELFARMRQELGRVYDEIFNDRRVHRKLQLLNRRPVLMPEHVGPMVPGQAETSQ